MALFGGFQADAFQPDFQTTVPGVLVSDSDYIVIQPWQYWFRQEKTPGEIVTLTFDFSLELHAGEFLVGFPNVLVTKLYGSDLFPALMLNGTAEIEAAGKRVLVPVAGGVDSNDYIFTVDCATSNVHKHVEWPGILAVRNFPNFRGAP